MVFALVGYLAFFYWLTFPAKYIGFKPKGEPYTATKFEFRYGTATRFVNDPHNKMQWVYGDLPDSITIDDSGVRLIVYHSHNAIKKSWGDSMEAFPDSFYHGGGFGVWGDGVAYYVDSSGTIQENP